MKDDIQPIQKLIASIDGQNQLLDEILDTPKLQKKKELQKLVETLEKTQEKLEKKFDL